MTTNFDNCKPETQAMLQRVQREHHNYLQQEDVRILATDPASRLSLLLVRCGGGRFLAPAQDVAHFIDIIERDARVQHWLDAQETLIGVKCCGEDGKPLITGTYTDYIRDVSLPVGFTVDGDAPAPLTYKEVQMRKAPWFRSRQGTPTFNENDCSGAFDGTRVTSDADEGL